MTLSLITINWNNAAGLEKTLRSVETQGFRDFEHIIVDGASTDGSVACIQAYAERAGYRVDWSSEPDNGIYNAMNKGIRRATGDYIQILNSGDCLAADDVLTKMHLSLHAEPATPFPSGEGRGEAFGKASVPVPAILYGNMVKVFPDGHTLRDKCFAGQPITMLGMYTGTLNHSPAWIRRSLFESYGYYDESLRIVSDWKWYLQALVVGHGNTRPLAPQEVRYVDQDVILFDMTGISETNKGLDKAERRQVLETLVPSTILADYDRFGDDIDLTKRLHRHAWAFKLVRFLERVLFKYEKRQKKHTGESRYL